MPTLGQVDEHGARSGGSLRGVATMTVSATSNQTGAAIGAHAFDAVGPLGVVAVRHWVAAAVLLPLARPPVTRMSWRQWWPVLLLAVVFGAMNLSLYTAVDRVGLALAVTLEFLGPLGVALAGSRTRRDLLIAAAAAAGVYVLVLPGPSSDLLGVGAGLLAAACWAAYIVLNRVVGERLPGLQAPALATTVCALVHLPVVVVLAADGRLAGAPLLSAVAAGVLASAVPYALDLAALRFVRARFFGVFMSVHPVAAAVAGLLLLSQHLVLREWIGIAVVVLANVVAVASGGATAPSRLSARRRPARRARTVPGHGRAAGTGRPHSGRRTRRPGRAAPRRTPAPPRP